MSNSPKKNRTSRRDFLKATAVVSASGLVLANASQIMSQTSASSVSQRPKVQGTETEKNLLKAFAGESQARNRYTYYADQARKDGFQQIAAIFEETADHEREHAKRFFSHLKGGNLEIMAPYPAGFVGDTEENLLAAAEGEHEEWAILYPEFAKIASNEGFPDIAQLFQNVCIAEKMHERRYRKLLKNVEEGLVFERPQKVVWQCRNCGYVSEGVEPHASCPACAFPQSYFQIFPENW
jgi:Rubrerythrin